MSHFQRLDASNQAQLTVPYGKLSLVLFATAAIPIVSYGLQNTVSKNPLQYNILWVIAFLINVICVSLPGRFDGEQKDGKVTISWETVFAPSGYAFAIWGVIYLGELLLSIYTGFYGKPVQLMNKAMMWWIMGNLFQSLWCACFRPAFRAVLWMPATLLGLGAGSYLMLAKEITNSIFLESNSFQTKALLYLFRVPISLHTGWLTAATLLNFNSYAATSNFSMGSQIALAIASAYIATAGGAAAAIWLKDPVLALTVAWALAAVANETKYHSKIDLHKDTKEALVLTENTLVRSLVAVALGVPVFRKMF